VIRNEGWLPARAVRTRIAACHIAELHGQLRVGANAKVGEPCVPGGLNQVEFASMKWPEESLGQGEVLTIALSDVLDSQALVPGTLASTQGLGPLEVADFYVVADYRVWPFPWRHITAGRFTGTRKAESDVEWRALPSHPPPGGYKQPGIITAGMQVDAGGAPLPSPFISP
jgi:hypothetical protein